MAKNPYFRYKESESRLMEDLTIETIKSHGEDFMYIKRDSIGRDYLFGEDHRAKFKDSATVEMYLKNFENHNGAEVLSRFGVELKDRITTVVSKRRFEEEVTAAYTDVLRPREGDLIFYPVTSELYEIQFVENEVPFFQGNRSFTYEITAQTYQFNQDIIETGVDLIDGIETDSKDLLVYMNITGGAGSFLINEVAYVGTTLSSASFTGKIVYWDSNARNTLHLKAVEGDITGAIGSVIKGSESGATATISSNAGNTVDHILVNPFDNNDSIQKESRTIFDFSEIDPFSEGNY